MGMLKDTCAYLKRSFWALAVVAVVPSLMIAFFAKPFSMITFLPTMFVAQTEYSFGEIFMMILTPISNASVLGGMAGYLIFFALLWIAVCLGICICEKHLKTGELSLVVRWHQFSSYLLPTLIALVVWLGFMLVSMVAQSGLISLIHFVCGATPPSVADCVLSSLVSVIVLVAVIYCMVNIMFLPLIMVYYGYGLREAFLESLRLTTKNFKELLAGFIVPVAVLLGFNFLLSLGAALLKTYAGISEAARYWIDYGISVIIHTFMIVYLIAYDIISFYKLSQLERRDVRY